MLTEIEVEDGQVSHEDHSNQSQYSQDGSQDRKHSVWHSSSKYPQSFITGRTIGREVTVIVEIVPASKIEDEKGCVVEQHHHSSKEGRRNGGYEPSVREEGISKEIEVSNDSHDTDEDTRIELTCSSLYRCSCSATCSDDQNPSHTCRTIDSASHSSSYAWQKGIHSHLQNYTILHNNLHIYLT